MKNYKEPEVSVIRFGMTEAITSEDPWQDANGDDGFGAGSVYSENFEWWG